MGTTTTHNDGEDPVGVVDDGVGIGGRRERDKGENEGESLNEANNLLLQN